MLHYIDSLSNVADSFRVLVFSDSLHTIKVQHARLDARVSFP
jgi:hypothetical protein